jgi:hypothetical protein
VVARSAQKVFTDAEWERALKQASQMKRALYGGEGVGDESGTAQSIPEDQMEFMEPAAGQTFSEAQWERAFKQAPAYLRAMKSDEATDSDADDAAVRTSTAGRDAAGEIAQFELEDAERNKVFAEAEWDRAFSDAGPALEVRRSSNWFDVARFSVGLEEVCKADNPGLWQNSSPCFSSGVDL